jgi:hypothetical protein
VSDLNYAKGTATLNSPLTEQVHERTITEEVELSQSQSNTAPHAIQQATDLPLFKIGALYEVPPT